VARSPGKAAAWVGIAAQSGDPRARELYLKILPMLGSADVDESVALERAYQTVALELQVNFDNRVQVGTPPKRLNTIYPSTAMNEGWEGYVYLLVVVDEQGNSRDPQVLISNPPGKFDAASVEALLGARWEPATFECNPVASHVGIPSADEGHRGCAQIARVALAAKSHEGILASESRPIASTPALATPPRRWSRGRRATWHARSAAA
jgi:TonB family protein